MRFLVLVVIVVLSLGSAPSFAQRCTQTEVENCGSFDSHTCWDAYYGGMAQADANYSSCLNESGNFNQAIACENQRDADHLRVMDGLMHCIGAY